MVATKLDFPLDRQPLGVRPVRYLNSEIRLLISFQTEEIRDICLKTECAEQAADHTVARALFSVLADIRAAETAVDLFLASFSDGDDTEVQKMELNFGKSGALTLVSNHALHNGPNFETVDWSQVKRVRIVEVSFGDV